jgi:hypothetical protein
MILLEAISTPLLALASSGAAQIAYRIQEDLLSTGLYADTEEARHSGKMLQ